MDMRYPKIPWEVSKKRANMRHLWTFKNLNRLVVVNLDIAKDENELHILVRKLSFFLKGNSVSGLIGVIWASFPYYMY